MIANQIRDRIGRKRGQLFDNLFFSFEFGFEFLRPFVPGLRVIRRVSIEIKGDVDRLPAWRVKCDRQFAGFPMVARLRAGVVQCPFDLLIARHDRVCFQAEAINLCL